ncbi:MAG: hemin-degrading factor [Candidatus Nitrosocosmicus sp.]|nr:hemin-degrading factor [Candidatus Nitrosocosmicus sp.]
MGRTTFEALIKDILLLENIMISVRSNGAVAEVRIEKDTPFRLNEQWATIGDEKGRWHIHVNISEAKEARFVVESKDSGRKSYSIRFFNSQNILILRINFVKIYTPDNMVIEESLSQYENLFSKYGSKDSLLLSLDPQQ